MDQTVYVLSSDIQLTLLYVHRPPQLPPKPRKRRIGRTPPVGQPKLFGGSLEEYIDATGEEIPLIIKSCIRVINLYGLHHQGVFRVSGAQVEINHFKNIFESGTTQLSSFSQRFLFMEYNFLMHMTFFYFIICFFFFFFFVFFVREHLFIGFNTFPSLLLVQSSIITGSYLLFFEELDGILCACMMCAQTHLLS